MTAHETLGKRLKNAREKKGIKQNHAAKQIGVAPSTLAGYESDFRDPDTDTLKKLAEMYDVTIDYLLIGRGANIGKEFYTLTINENANTLIPKGTVIHYAGHKFPLNRDYSFEELQEELEKEFPEFRKDRTGAQFNTNNNTLLMYVTHGRKAAFDFTPEELAQLEKLKHEEVAFKDFLEDPIEAQREFLQAYELFKEMRKKREQDKSK